MQGGTNDFAVPMVQVRLGAPLDGYLGLVAPVDEGRLSLASPHSRLNGEFLQGNASNIAELQHGLRLGTSPLETGPASRTISTSVRASTGGLSALSVSHSNGWFCMALSYLLA